MNHKLETVKNLLKRSNLEDALLLLREMDDRGEATAETQYLIGTILHRQDKLSEAVEAFQRSLLIDPDFADSAISLSIVYNDTGNYSAARKAFQQAEKIASTKKSFSSSSTMTDKELSRRHFELGEMYQQVRRYDAAANEFIRAVKLDETNIDARINLAKCHAQRKNSKEAEKILLDIIEHNPDQSKARVNLALLYYSLGNTAGAQLELSEALMKDPKNEKAKLYLELVQKSATQTTFAEDF